MTGKADLGGELQAVADVVDERGLRQVEADARHRILEEEAVFGLLDRFELRADQLDIIFVEDACVGEIDGEIECRLSAYGGQQRELAGAAFVSEHLRLDADDLFDVLACERLDVGAVGEFGVGHDGGRVRVHQHHFIAFLPERLARLRAGVVELGGLADDDRAGADHENLGDVIPAWHLVLLPSESEILFCDGESIAESCSIKMAGLKPAAYFLNSCIIFRKSRKR